MFSPFSKRPDLVFDAITGRTASLPNYFSVAFHLVIRV